jgi:alkaline phosphatase
MPMRPMPPSLGKTALILAAALAGLAACSEQKAEKTQAQASPDAAAPAASSNIWLKEGAAALAARLAQKPIEGRARNVILFIGDGMGVSTITAARIFDGQSRGTSGEENILPFEALPYVALAKTYNADAQVPDSAGTATALVTGAKTRIGVLALSDEQPRNQCQGADAHRLATILEQAEDAGMATGIVTTARLTHATPASTYAHAANRDWEDDGLLPPEAKANGCADIARQFAEFAHGDGIEVAMGGGRRHFLPEDAPDPEDMEKRGSRRDGRDLVAEWQARNPGGAYVWSLAQLAALDLAATPKLLGLFAASHMSYEADRAKDPGGEPSLSEMTATAIDLLARQEKGYFLMVEGGRIDHAHHAGNAYRALGDAQAFAQAVAVALEKTTREETLIIVTADHSHVFTIAGYPKRGNPILGLVKGFASEDEASDAPALADDGKPYTTLGYGNGPGALAGPRAMLSEEMALAPDFRQQALVPLGSETHGGEDVAVFAAGPWAHLVSGVMEQNVIYHIMRHALGLEERQPRD